MRTHLLSLNLMLILTTCISAEEPSAGKDLFPMTVGNRWTYRIQGQDDRLTVKAEAEEMVGEIRCTALEGRLQNGPIRADAAGRLIARELIAVKKGRRLSLPSGRRRH